MTIIEPREGERADRMGRAQSLVELARRESLPGRSIEHFEEALQLLEVDGPNVLTADALRWMGTVYRDLGDSVEAEVLYTKSLRLAVQLHAIGSQAHALNCLALMAQRRAQTEVAGGFYRRAAGLALKANDHRLKGMIEQNLGVLASIRGDLDGALVSYNDSLAAFEAGGDEEGISWVLNNLGILYTMLDDHEAAENALTRGLGLAERRHDAHLESLLLVNLAALAVKSGDDDSAGEMLERALAIADLRQDRVRRAEALKLQAMILRGKGEPTKAIDVLDEAHDLAVATGDTLLTAEVMRELGDTWSQVGDARRATGLWERARSYFRELGAVVDVVDIESRLSPA